MPLSLKPGVRLRGILPEMVVGLMVCESVYDEWEFPLVVTSANDSEHSPRSRHYLGAAVDLRIGHGIVPVIHRNDLVEDLRDSLGPDFFVLLEGDHIHVSYKPGV
jgi:hypothetical protein